MARVWIWFLPLIHLVLPIYTATQLLSTNFQGGFILLDLMIFGELVIFFAQLITGILLVIICYITTALIVKYTKSHLFGIAIMLATTLALPWVVVGILMLGIII